MFWLFAINILWDHMLFFSHDGYLTSKEISPPAVSRWWSLTNNSSHQLLASPVHLIAIVDVPEGCKCNTLAINQRAHLLPRRTLFFIFLADTFVMNYSISDSLLTGGIWLSCFWEKETQTKIILYAVNCDVVKCGFIINYQEEAAEFTDCTHSMSVGGHRVVISRDKPPTFPLQDVLWCHLANQCTCVIFTLWMKKEQRKKEREYLCAFL